MENQANLQHLLSSKMDHFQELTDILLPIICLKNRASGAKHRHSSSRSSSFGRDILLRLVLNTLQDK